MLMASPQCTAFSMWQFLNQFRSADQMALQRARVQATIHIDFVMSLCREQVEAGRYFLYEHN